MELDSERTEVLIGAEKAAPRIFQYFANATKMDVCLDSEGPALAMQVGAYRKLYLDFKGSGRKMRCITEITKGNVADCKELMKCARVRHLDDMKGNFSVSQKEYVASSIIRGVQPMPQLIYSNSGEIVAQNQSLFDTLWNKAIPAAQRIREIEESKPAERTEVIYGQERITQTLGLFLDEIESEVRVIVPQPAMLDYLERLEIFHHLLAIKKKKNILIKIVSPFGETNKSTFRRINPHVQCKSVEPLPMSSIAFVRDKKEILLTTIVNAENRLELDRLIHSTDTLLVEKMMATFDAWWNQVENTNARIEEKTHAELLLDLITHDIGNHNQIVAPNLELARMILDKTAGGNISLDEEDSEDLRQYLASATRAFDRSISLVDNIRRLEKMYREKNTKLTGQDLNSAIESAISMVKNSTRNQKDISFSLNLGGKEGPFVLADNLLEEVFVNLFNNAVKATEDGSVKIEVDVQQYTLGREKYWIVTVSDYGQGIPDDQKSELFARFYSKAKGTGLGLSIVRALIERYKGQVWVSDRVSGDYARGASFGMILHGTKA